MSDADRVRGWFTSGALLPPDPALANTVDLARALAALAGAPAGPSPGADEIGRRIGSAEHVAFVLVDGLGLNLVEALPAGSFLHAQLALELRAVFPATTAAALTSLATGQWPARHAVPAWWTYLPEHGLTATILPFVERFSERPLAELGVSPAEAFPEPVLMSSHTRDTRSLLPRAIAGSAYTRYTSGGTPVAGYDGLTAAVDAVIARVAGATAPTYTYLYYPELDSLEHDHGPWSEQAQAELRHVEQELARLAEGIAGRGRLVVSADHGQIEVPPEGKHIIERDEPLSARLVAPPYGEPRVPFFRAREGAGEAFERACRERLGEAFALLPIDEADALRLFGPEPLSAAARGRIGDYLGIAASAQVVVDGAAREKHGPAFMRGFHAGMTPDEMRIPLIVA
jgi:hypothetical protein